MALRVLGGCGLKPLRLDFGPVAGATALEERIARALNRSDVAPNDDVHASAEDRREIAAVLLRRCVAGLVRSTNQGGQ